MDITLERILNELKTQGKMQKDLAEFLGIAPNIFGNWKRGANSSYKKYIHAIADYLDVSVEYLRGETDIKKAPITRDERIDKLYEEAKDLSDAEFMALSAYIAGLKANKKLD